VSVTLSWDTLAFPFCDIGYLPDLKVARWDVSLSQWQDHGNGGTTGNIGAGTIISSAAVTSFSPFTLASATWSNPLPIQLLSFTGNCNNDNVILNWSTATETNNDFFTIERSTNGMTFESIGTIKAVGNSAGKLNYSFIDDAPLAVNLYYRLRQTDLDGKNEAFNLIFVSCNDERPLSIYLKPNPATNELIIGINEKRDEIKSIFITNELGQIVITEKISLMGETKIYTEQLSKGVYFVFSSSTDFKPIKFIKQ